MCPTASRGCDDSAHRERMRRMVDWVKYNRLGDEADYTVLSTVSALKEVSDRARSGGEVVTHDVLTAILNHCMPRGEDAYMRSTKREILNNWRGAFGKDLKIFVKRTLSHGLGGYPVFDMYVDEVKSAREKVISATSEACGVCSLSIPCLVTNWREMCLSYETCFGIGREPHVRRCSACGVMFRLPWFLLDGYEESGLGSPIISADDGIRRCPRADTTGYCSYCGGDTRAFVEHCERMGIAAPVVSPMYAEEAAWMTKKSATNVKSP